MRPVIVTTEYRGVFFFFFYDTSGDTIYIKNARNCIYWDSSIGGFMGLASEGPNNNCRIGAEVDNFEARKVTSIIDVSKKAEDAWKSAPVFRGQ